MSSEGIVRAMRSDLRGDLRLAYIGIGDASGVPSISLVQHWVNCDEVRANELVAELLLLGLLRVIAGFMYAPDIYDGDLPAERTGRRLPTTEMRRYIFERDGEVCTYCGCTEGPFHVDHIIPHSRGGETSLDNLTVACRSCNVRKRTRTPQEMGWVQ